MIYNPEGPIWHSEAWTKPLGPALKSDPVKEGSSSLDNRNIEFSRILFNYGVAFYFQLCNGASKEIAVRGGRDSVSDKGIYNQVNREGPIAFCSKERVQQVLQARYLEKDSLEDPIKEIQVQIIPLYLTTRFSSASSKGWMFKDLWPWMGETLHLLCVLSSHKKGFPLSVTNCPKKY